jgi:hypothetical protein
VSPLSIGVAITAAIALVAGVTKEGVDVLGLAADPTLLSIGAVGLMLALTTFRSPLISPFLRVFSTIFAVECRKMTIDRRDVTLTGSPPLAHARVVRVIDCARHRN